MEVDKVFEVDSTDPNKTTDAIPDEIWNMFPSKGTYLKNIIKFSGYETIDSVLKLKSKDEIEKMFLFVKTMADIVEEKDAMFGIFSKCPEKVMLLPGLEPVLTKFLDAVEKLKSEKSSKKIPKDSAKKITMTKPTSSCPPLSVSEIHKRMLNWIHNQPEAKEKLAQVGLKPVDSFKITELKDSRDCHYVCKVCQVKIALPTTNKGAVSISNAQRHVTKRCWLNPNRSYSPIPQKVAKIDSFLGEIVSTHNEDDSGECKKLATARWFCRDYRKQQALMNASALPGQRKITDYFENTISDFVDQNDQIKENINTLCGNKKSASVRPILRKIFENAERNSMKESSKGHRHDETIKKTIACKKKIKEGEFRFDELANHLKEWKAPKYVHIHLDDTRIINK
ncbi:Hypothetical predicted protein, partial [Paramuricea clavata]